ncbi:thiolase family protein [Caldimonas caldifontis]|uniref:Steroid 3-ketoacyl-CoA thiolase n=1 Tax=Caldimonas caldifontis TaxID=1452508 RepID=A0A2S5SXU8_9BURK|nr:thiolase family protein [Caldimonas caldifontis]PPE67542.1 steroid 3-ketoacyl-CoA thiolase [Caldimonas caldifontis]
MSQPVIIDAVRTAFGRRKGALRETRPDDLLAFAVRGLVERSGVVPEQIDDLIAGCVSQAGEQGANVGRLAVLLSGLPTRVAGVSLNRMCGSSQQAVHFAAQAIAAGDARYVIAGGVESMSRVPMFLDVTLGRFEFTGFEALNPALLERHALVHQVESAERIAEHWGLSRADCDEFAKESHRRAHAAAEAGRHREVLPTPGLDADGQPITLVRDEGIRAVLDEARMAAMNPVFRAPGEGVVTAANASQISDGASAVLVADEATARADGLTPRARFRARVVVGSDPVMQLNGVIPATHEALKRAGIGVADLDWIEVNEAFASVALCWAREFQPDMARLNPWGGAIAHGHPLGGTGGALMAKMLHGLEATGGTLGLQVMCIGHGMATATVIERV